MTIADLMSFLVSLGDVCLAGAVVACLFTLAESASVLCFGGQTARRSAAQPAVTVLKPLCGAEPDLPGRLTPFCQQDYGGPVQVVFGARNEDAPAIAVAQQIKSQFPDRAIDLAVETRSRGSNGKVSNLISMLSCIRHDTLVLSDSDIEVGPDYLRSLTALLAQPGVGAVTCLYYGIGEGIWQRMAALAVNSHFLPQAIMGARLGAAKYCCGATVALRRSMLDRIGGFVAFADVLADDYAMGAAVRSLGYEVVTAPFLVGHRCCEISLRQFVLHQIRIARTIRSIEPIGYAGTIITHPWPLALLGMLSGNTTAAWVAAIALVSRLALCRCVEWRFALPRQHYLLVPLQDILAFAVYLVSFFGTTVHWRGAEYRITTDGDLVEDQTERDLSMG